MAAVNRILVIAGDSIGDDLCKTEIMTVDHYNGPDTVPIKCNSGIIYIGKYQCFVAVLCNLQIIIRCIWTTHGNYSFQ